MTDFEKQTMARLLVLEELVLQIASAQPTHIYSRLVEGLQEARNPPDDVTEDERDMWLRVIDARQDLEKRLAAVSQG